MAMSKFARQDILNLSIAERIELIGDLWDSMAEVPEAITLTEAPKAELNRRLDAYDQDPTAGAPWPAVRDSLSRRPGSENLAGAPLTVLPGRP
jgi:putative addiction module component (TIGR02574 family)